jgi:aminopeptidase N
MPQSAQAPKRALAAVVLWLSFFALPGRPTFAAVLPGGGYDVLDYRAELDVRPADKRVAGEVEIDLASRVEALREVDLEAPGLEIAGVWSGDRKLPFHRDEAGSLIITLDPPARKGETRTLRVRYAGSPQKGMSFGADQVLTSFHTSSWLVSKSDPGDKATLTLTLTLPAGLEVVANGRQVSRVTQPDGRVRHVWRENRPYSSYLYGFAAARFKETSEKEGEVTLRYLSSGIAPEQLATIFTGTGEMLRFFAERAGVPYPAATYTQALLPEAPPQEMAELTLLSEGYGRSVLADPREDYLVAHELAHQWWGNLLTCADWSDFWLNEGLVTYMTAAWKERAWGRDEYLREILMARLRYERAAADGKDRPLVWTGWAKADEMGGPITYSKGALVLHLLRAEIGDTAFWKGLRDYTTTAAATGGVVRTPDLRKAMERASGRGDGSLAGFFDQWVFSVQPTLTARHRLEKDAVVIDIEQKSDQKTEKPWRIGMRIAVETDRERVSRRVELTRAKESVRIPVSGTVLSVRVDEGGTLPRSVEHERPWTMLVHQMTHEPDPAGRADALLALSKLCSASPVSPNCGGLPDALRQRTAEDTARIVRQLADRTLQGLQKPAAR